MLFFVGLAVVFGCVFGGFIMAGGKMAPIIKSAPVEGFIIVGSAIGAQLIGNSIGIFKGAVGCDPLFAGLDGGGSFGGDPL